MKRKVLPLTKAAVTDSGEFSGYANTFGNVDHGGDVTMPGAFAKALPEFLREGFLAWGHDWNDPVAMPKEAYEDEHGLFIKGQFHSTARAQEARTIAQERIAAGLTMGLSIGYAVENGTPNKSGGLDLHTIYPLWETSLVMVPMNAASYITAMKAQADAAGLAENVNRITEDIPAIVARFEQMAELRAKEDRNLSPTNRALVRHLEDSLAESAKRLQTLLTETEPESDRLAREVAEMRSRLVALGVPLTA